MYCQDFMQLHLAFSDLQQVCCNYSQFFMNLSMFLRLLQHLQLLQYHEIWHARTLTLLVATSRVSKPSIGQFLIYSNLQQNWAIVATFCSNLSFRAWPTQSILIEEFKIPLHAKFHGGDTLQGFYAILINSFRFLSNWLQFFFVFQ